ncbi:hypothetical protein D3C85_1816860 [compost metagenome]
MLALTGARTNNFQQGKRELVSGFHSLTEISKLSSELSSENKVTLRGNYPRSLTRVSLKVSIVSFLQE